MGLIELLGDRRNSGFCTMCGTDLLLPWNDYQCCSKCTGYIEHCKGVTSQKKGKSRRVNKTILTRKNIMRQIKPIGGIPT